MSAFATPGETKAEGVPAAMTTVEGSVFHIDLPCAAGRGFSWQLVDSSSEKNVQLVGQRFTNGPVDKDGADGIQHFEFKAITPGIATIKLVYGQPFKKTDVQDSEVKTVTVTVIKGAPAK